MKLRAVHILCAVTAALATSGCGTITPTGPVRAGGAAAVVREDRASDHNVQLYFASPYGIRQASRPSNGPMTAQQALNLLLEGPNPTERARGLGSYIPPMGQQAAAVAGKGGIDLYLPLSVRTGELDDTALSQLVCTLAHAQTVDNAPAEQVVVRIHEKESYGAMEAFELRCGAQLMAVPAAKQSPPD
ncbi:GerMN domain-containing protein [Streptomyces erythrochromogenes]|uniref:GerMN domain-containing protein n=1 Tax=Streptomyces erythrochromogenes TaxID=285574 RepID=UPI003696691D